MEDGQFNIEGISKVELYTIYKMSQIALKSGKLNEQESIHANQLIQSIKELLRNA